MRAFHTFFGIVMAATTVAVAPVHGAQEPGFTSTDVHSTTDSPMTSADPSNGHSSPPTVTMAAGPVVATRRPWWRLLASL